MTVSSSTDFTLTASDMITAARRKLGVQAQEEPLEAADLVSGLQTLNMMLKAWQADGVMCWTLTEGSLTLVSGTESYVFGAGGSFTTVPLEITDARINRGTNDIPMYRLSREDYYALPNKTNTGYPTQFYYDRQRSGGTLFVWPAPDASAGTFKFTYRRIIMDMDASADSFDVPQEWYEAIMYGLADRLAEDYGMVSSPEAQKATAKAAQTYGVVKDFDVGEGIGSVTIMPYGDDGWRR